MSDISDLLWVEDTQETILIGAIAAGPAGEQGPAGPEGGVRTVVQTDSVDQTMVASCSLSSAKFLIEATTDTDRQLAELWVTRVGSEAYWTQAAFAGSASGTLAAYACDVSAGTIRLLATPASAATTTFKVLRFTVEL